MKKFLIDNKLEISLFISLVVLVGIFMSLAPSVFLKKEIYLAVLQTVAPIILLVVPMATVVASGEIDLSFTSIMGISALTFSMLVTMFNFDPFLSFFIAIIISGFIGYINSQLVTTLGLSSLILTLGMNYLLRGLTSVIANGQSIVLGFLNGSIFQKMLTGKIGIFPVQMIWVILSTLIIYIIFYKTKLGGYIRFVGDNHNSAKEMGVNVKNVKAVTFIILAALSGIAGIMITVSNNIFYATVGEQYLLLVLVATFLGGTPTWGGVGSILGSVIAAIFIGFINTGITTINLPMFYTRFFYGLILILAIISHKYVGYKKIK